MPRIRKTKIVATLGPSCDSAEVLRDLLSVSIDVFRINASHGNWTNHARQIAMARRMAGELGRHPAILLDLQGPKIRLGEFQGGLASLTVGSRFSITTEPKLGNASSASTSYATLAAEVAPGDRLVLADGAVELRAVATDGCRVTCTVLRGGTIRDHQGINLPGVKLSTPSLTPKDHADLDFGIDNAVDMVALSFVREAADVLQLRKLLDGKNVSLPVIAKIETAEACQNLDSIMQAADGLMVARGDLGVEVSLARVPALQKAIIEQTMRHGKFVVTATQMLESMIANPTPTRAEVSDVANAVYDGTDAVMLSSETAYGSYPVEAARVIDAVASEAEVSRVGTRIPSSLSGDDHGYAEIVADASCRAAEISKARGIVVFSTTGATAGLIACRRPRVPIFAIVPSDGIARRLAPVYGVDALAGLSFPSLATESANATLRIADDLLLRARKLEPGDTVVIVAGEPLGIPGSTNLMRLHRVAESGNLPELPELLSPLCR